MVVANPRADLDACAEIERRIGHGAGRLRQRDCAGVDGEEMIRRHGEMMIENVLARARTGQIEKAVVGEIDHGRPIGPRRHVERQLHRSGQAPGHLHVERAGITLFAVGAGMRECHGRTVAVLDRDNPPVAAIETFQPAMQRVGPIVDRELHLAAVEHEARAGDAVGIAADGGPEELPPGEIAIERRHGRARCPRGVRRHPAPATPAATRHR